MKGSACSYLLDMPYFPAHKTHREFLLGILEKKIMMNVF